MRILKRAVSSDICNRLIRDIGANLEATQRRVGDKLARLLCVGGLGNAESHVGLAGGQPDISHENIFQGDGCAAGGHFQVLTLSICLHGIEFDHPFACLIRSYGFSLVCKVDLYLGLWFSPSPNGHGHFPLKNAMVGEDFSKGQTFAEQCGGKK